MSYRVTCCECFAVFDGLDPALAHECESFESGEIVFASFDEVASRDGCPRCGGDHDRIDRREPCPSPFDGAERERIGSGDGLS